jgi:hypothetical protein
VDGANLEAEVVLGEDKALKLREPLPYHEWPGPRGAEAEGDSP